VPYQFRTNWPSHSSSKRALPHRTNRNCYKHPWSNRAFYRGADGNPFVRVLQVTDVSGAADGTLTPSPRPRAAGCAVRWRVASPPLDWRKREPVKVRGAPKAHRVVDAARALSSTRATGR